MSYSSLFKAVLLASRTNSKGLATYAKRLAAFSAQLAILGLSLQALAQAKPVSAQRQLQMRDECVILDNDYDIDDMQAIPLVLGSKHVAAIVQSEGYTLPQQAAPAVDALVNQIPDQPNSRKIPIIVGGKQVQGPDLDRWPWLRFFRSMMNQSNGLLSSVPAPWPLDQSYPETVAQAVRNCKNVEILIIGTYTSFNQYAPLIANQIKRVVIMGQPIGNEARTPGRESFNCNYDLEACKTAMPLLQKFNTSFVDIPRFHDCHDTTTPSPHCYNPSLSMVVGTKRAGGHINGGLIDKGLPGRLKLALLNNIQCSSFYTTTKTKGRPCTSLSTWEPAAVATGPGGEMLLWDQTAALFLLDPSKFSLYYKPGADRLGGKHYEPTLVDDSHQKTVQRLRILWTNYTNQSLTIK